MCDCLCWRPQPPTPHPSHPHPSPGPGPGVLHQGAEQTRASLQTTEGISVLWDMGATMPFIGVTLNAPSCLSIWAPCMPTVLIRAHCKVKELVENPQICSLRPRISLKDQRTLGVGCAGLTEAVSVWMRIPGHALHIHTSWSRRRQGAGELLGGTPTLPDFTVPKKGEKILKNYSELGSW